VSKVKLFNAVNSQLFGDSVDVGSREDHGEVSQVNVAESSSLNDELRLLDYCGKPGHKAKCCWTRLQLNTGKPAMIITEETNTSPVGVMAGLSKADSMPIGLISTKGEARESAVSVLASRDFDLFQESFEKDPDFGTFRPFLSQGTVEVGVETPVTILRDSGYLQTLIKEGVVAARKTDKYVVLGFLWGQGVVPLVLVRVKSSCFSGIANVACVHELPVTIWRELQQLEDDMHGVFPLCAVTRSMSVTNDHKVTPVVDDSLSLEGLFANPIASQDISSAVNAVTGRVALMAAQEQDDSLRLLFVQVSDSANDSGPTTRYFSQDGVLCRRWLPPTMSEEDTDWASITQIVLPHTYRHVLALVHDSRFSGHHGVRKTFNRLARKFYWPGMRRDVIKYCKYCHFCQKVGKANQAIPPFPLVRVPHVPEPFTTIQCDIVGPLPKTSSGFEYLFTVIDTSTRYLHAV
ncbi:pol Retrovirus-related Pol polyprotein from transposon-like 11, partial [Homarus americanus]